MTKITFRAILYIKSGWVDQNISSQPQIKLFSLYVFVFNYISHFQQRCHIFGPKVAPLFWGSPCIQFSAKTQQSQLWLVDGWFSSVFRACVDFQSFWRECEKIRKLPVCVSAPKKKCWTHRTEEGCAPRRKKNKYIFIRIAIKIQKIKWLQNNWGIEKSRGDADQKGGGEGVRFAGWGQHRVAGEAEAPGPPCGRRRGRGRGQGGGRR